MMPTPHSTTVHRMMFATESVSRYRLAVCEVLGDGIVRTNKVGRLKICVRIWDSDYARDRRSVFASSAMDSREKLEIELTALPDP